MRVARAITALFAVVTMHSLGAHAQMSASTSGLAAQIQSLRAMMESFSAHANTRIFALEASVRNNSEKIEDLEALLELIANRPVGNVCTTTGYFWDGNKCSPDTGHFDSGDDGAWCTRNGHEWNGATCQWAK